MIFAPISQIIAYFRSFTIQANSIVHYSLLCLTHFHDLTLYFMNGFINYSINSTLNYFLLLLDCSFPALFRHLPLLSLIP